jgi:peroxiredoxin
MSDYSKDLQELKQPLRNTEINKRNIDFIRSNLDSYISVTVFNNIVIGNALSLKESRQLFDSLSVKVKNTLFGKRVDNLIRRQENTLTGVTAPDFSGKDIDGKLIRLSDFRGGYVFLDFWASWCVNCMEGEPYIENLYKKYASQGIKFIAVSYDETEADWRSSAKRHGKNWYNIYDDNYQGPTVTHNADVISGKYPTAIPRYYIINPEGKIIGQWRGFSESIINEIEQMLDERL